MCPEIRKPAELSKGLLTPFLLRFWNAGLRLARGRRLAEVGSLVYHFTNEETEALIGDLLKGPTAGECKVGSRTSLLALPTAHICDGWRALWQSPHSWSSCISSHRHLASLTVGGSGQPWKVAAE